MAAQQKIFVQNAQNLYIYTPSSNAFSAIGPTGSLLTDIAALSNGAVYGVGFSSLYSVNTTTGNATYLKSLSRSDINALGVDGNGQLYVAGNSTTTIYKLNASTGAMTSFAAASAGSAGDLVVLNGKLWLATTANTLESFDLVSGAKIDSVHHGISNIFGLSISETGQLYGFADTKAYVFDIATGAATEVATFPIGQSVYGASQAASDWQQWYSGSSISDLLPASNGNDFVAGLDGNDTLNGLQGNDRLIGGAGNDSIDGGSGIDSSIFSGTKASYSLSKSQSGLFVSSKAEGSDTLTNIERLVFSDTQLAFDLDSTGNAGQAMEFIGVVAPSLLNSAAVRGVIISLFDQGQTMESLSQLALELDLLPKASNTALANTVYQNVIGQTANKDMTNMLVEYIEGHGQANFVATIANMHINVDLVGLQQTGIEFI